MDSEKMILQGKAEAKAGIHYELDPNDPPIGVGGSGTVRKGIQVNEKTGTTREVAIKFLFDDLNDNAVERSRREASIRIVHENLVEMIGFVQVGEQDLYGKNSVHYHVVSELLKGVMLFDLLNGVTKDKDGVEYPAVVEFYNLLQSDRNKFAIKIVRSVLSGLLALHDNGYIHRDIDPSNIMITSEGKVKLIDMGIAKRLNNLTTDGGHTMMGQFIGKAAFAPPEQVRGDIRSQGATTDIYSVGIMLFQLITGQLPFNGSTEEVIDKQINGKMPLGKIENKSIRKIIDKATKKKQKERFQTAAEFRAALDQVDTSAGGSGLSLDLPSWVWWVIVPILGIALGVVLALFV